MKKSSRQFIFFISTHKQIFIFIIPVLFVVFFLFFVFLPASSTNQQPPIEVANTPTTVITISPESSDNYDPEYHNVEEIEGIIKSESMPDGNIKHTFSSFNTERPNIIIATREGLPIFQRIVNPPSMAQATFDFVEIYGEPKWIFKGSVFYGADSVVYIYADLGFSLIINPETGLIYEQHIFEPTSIENYIHNFGEDIPAQP